MGGEKKKPSVELTWYTLILPPEHILLQRREGHTQIPSLFREYVVAEMKKGQKGSGFS